MLRHFRWCALFHCGCRRRHCKAKDGGCSSLDALCAFFSSAHSRRAPSSFRLPKMPEEELADFNCLGLTDYPAHVSACTSEPQSMSCSTAVLGATTQRHSSATGMESVREHDTDLSSYIVAIQSWQHPGGCPPREDAIGNLWRAWPTLAYSWKDFGLSILHQ